MVLKELGLSLRLVWRWGRSIRGIVGSLILRSLVEVWRI